MAWSVEVKNRAVAWGKLARIVMAVSFYDALKYEDTSKREDVRLQEHRLQSLRTGCWRENIKLKDTK